MDSLPTWRRSVDPFSAACLILGAALVTLAAWMAWGMSS